MDQWNDVVAESGSSIEINITLPPALLLRGNKNMLVENLIS